MNDLELLQLISKRTHEFEALAWGCFTGQELQELCSDLNALWKKHFEDYQNSLEEAIKTGFKDDHFQD